MAATSDVTNNSIDRERQQAIRDLKEALSESNKLHQAETIEKKNYRKAIDEFIRKLSGKSKEIIALQNLTDGLTEKMASDVPSSNNSRGIWYQTSLPIVNGPQFSNVDGSRTVMVQTSTSPVTHGTMLSFQAQPHYAPAQPGAHLRTRQPQQQLAPAVHLWAPPNNPGIQTQPVMARPVANAAVAQQGSKIDAPGNSLGKRVEPNIPHLISQYLPLTNTEMQMQASDAQQDTALSSGSNPAAESLLMLQRSTNHGIGIASTAAQGNSEPSFTTGPSVQTLKLKRVDDKLLAMWSPPDLTSLGLTNSILEKMRANTTYHICVENKQYSRSSWSNVEAFKCVTKQCCYLFKPESPFLKHRVKVTWSIPDENVFRSVQEATSNARCIYSNLSSNLDVRVDKEFPIFISNSTTVYKGFRIQYRIYEVIVKCIKSDTRPRFYGSIEKLRKLQHANLAGYEFVGYEESIKSVITATEVLNYSLHSAVKEDRLPTTDCLIVVQQILSGLKYLHDHHVAHCNLKPKNVYFTSTGRNVKLAHFGIKGEIEKHFVDGNFTYHTFDYDTRCVYLTMYFIFTGFDYTKIVMIFGSPEYNCIKELLRKEKFEFRSSIDFKEPLIKEFTDDMVEMDMDEVDLIFELTRPFFWSEERILSYIKKLVTNEGVHRYINAIYIRDLCQYALTNDYQSINEMLAFAVQASHLELYERWYKIVEECETEVVQTFSEYVQPAPYRCLSGKYTKPTRKRKHSGSNSETNSGDSDSSG